MKSNSTGGQVVLNLDKTFNLEEARQSLRIGSAATHRSDIRAIPAALIALILYWAFMSAAPRLAELGFIPQYTVGSVEGGDLHPVSASPIPEVVVAFVSFMLAIVSGLLIASSRWYSFKAKDAMGAFTASIEMLATIIIAKHQNDKKAREEGLDLLKKLCYSVLLFATKKEVVEKEGGEQYENCYDIVLQRLGIYANCAGIFGELVTSSAGLIRWTMARGHLAVVVRFGLRRGLLQMSVAYFLVLFSLIVFDLWGFNSLPPLFASILVMVLAYLMAVLVSVAYNEANPILEMSGDGEFGLEGRLVRMIQKIEAMARQAGWQPAYLSIYEAVQGGEELRFLKPKP